MSFPCPTCGADTVTFLTRQKTTDAGFFIRRRHRCTSPVEHRFTTVQYAVADYERLPPKPGADEADSQEDN